MLFPTLPLLVFTATVGAARFSRRSEAPGPLSNGYIVEFESSLGQLGIRDVISPHAQLYAHLDASGLNWILRQEFNHSELFVGAAVAIEHPTALFVLNEAQVVKTAYPINTYTIPDTEVQVVGSPNGAASLVDTYAPHVMTGVDKLHAEGYLGKGLIVGIIDSGVDYTHPALGGCFGPGCKVAFGTGFGSNCTKENKTTLLSTDPMDLNGHGTHVAGIIGANPNNPYNISGVAYEATLAAYRVFDSCDDISYEDIVMMALMRAYDDGCDVINLSLGQPGGWTQSPLALVASRVADKGRVVTVSAGNDGQAGGWYMDDIAAGSSIIAVASVDNMGVSAQNLTVSTGYGPITYFDAVPFNLTGPHPIYATSSNASVRDDACNPLPDDTPDLANYVVVVREGGCELMEKIFNLALKGAEYIVMYNAHSGHGFNKKPPGLNVVYISDVDGAYLVEQLAMGTNLTVTFPQTGAEFYYTFADGGLVSYFSSYGPTSDLSFKPAAAAPGGNILSTYPVKLGSYSINSGTSMSAPFLAGSAALVLEAKGKSAKTAAEARSLLQTTSNVLPTSHNSSSLLQTAAQQGAGLIDVYNAVHYATIVTPGQLSLNDSAYFQGNQTITVMNTGNSSHTYELTHVPAGTAATFSGLETLSGPLALDDSWATVEFSDFNFTLAPGASKNVTLSFNPPQGLDPSTVPVYSGFVQVASDAGEILHTTYLGVASALKDIQVLDDTDLDSEGIVLPVLLGSDNDLVNATTYFSLAPGDRPTLFYRLFFPTPLLRIDLVSAAFDGSTAGSLDAWPTAGLVQQRAYVPKNWAGKEEENVGFYKLTWNGTLANTSYVAAGVYKLLLRALHATGDPEKESDYDSWLSPVLGLGMKSTGPG